MILKVGLSGGIGSGKSTVASLFADLGVLTLSADAIGHELSQPGEAGYQGIVKAFGSDILTHNGELDRERLGNLIFADPQRRKALEGILHPLIMQTLHQRAESSDSPYCVLDIPLLVNTDEQSRVDRILVVYSDIPTRVHRIQARSGWSEEKIRQVMNEQLADATLINAADDLIENNEEIVDLRSKVRGLHRLYMRLRVAAQS